MLEAGSRYYSQQRDLTALARRRITRRSAPLPELLRTLTVFQARAATLAVRSGVAALGEQGIPAAGATLVPAAFTVTPTTPSVLEGVTTDLEFTRIISTLVADSGRSAMGVFAASRDRQLGHIRQLTPPSCSRCAILAGRWYRWSDGFQRHPKCDCVMVPGSRDVATYDPYKAFQRGDISDLTVAQRQAIEDGADIGQVINARRGLQTANFAGRRTRASRLSPEAIYNVAGDDRTAALTLLQQHGYIR